MGNQTSFKIGNQFGKLNINEISKPRKFATPEVMLDAAIEYMQWCQDNPIYVLEVYGKDATEIDMPKMRAPSVQGFTAFCGTYPDVFTSYRKIPSYSALCSYIENYIFTLSFEGAAAGVLNPAIIARKLGLVDKKEVESKGNVKVVLTLPDNGRRITPPAQNQIEDAQIVQDL